MCIIITINMYNIEIHWLSITKEIMLIIIIIYTSKADSEMIFSISLFSVLGVALPNIHLLRPFVAIAVINLRVSPNTNGNLLNSMVAFEWHPGQALVQCSMSNVHG